MLKFQYSNAAFSYKGKTVVSGVSFEVGDGVHIGITGKVGSGKTMLLKSLTGILPLKEGERYFEHEGKEISAYDFSLLTELVEFSEQNKFFKPGSHFYQQRYQSLEDDESRSLLVKDYLEARGMDLKDEFHATILSKGRVDQLFNRKLIHISSGQRKRMQLCIALSKKPRLLLLDHPYTGIDQTTRIELDEWLNEMSESFGIQLVIAANESELPSFVKNKLVVGSKGDSYGDDPQNRLDQLIEALQHKSAATFNSAINMQGVNLGYNNVEILQGLDWQVDKGDRVGMKGENGSGKSSLLSLVYGDNPLAYNKEIYLFDKKRGTGESIWDIKRNIGFVSSEFHLYMSDHITCEKLIGTGYFDQLFIPRKLNEKELQRIDLFLTYFGVMSLKSRYFHEISIGEQRLILLIRALIKNPPLLLLDEPYHCFDDDTIEKANTLIETLINTFQSTLVFISHSEEVFPKSINKRFELIDGRLKSI
ncbi:MAG: ATP-binding cassette domain-containing protein [Cyclobacteriaceae bacterium]